MGIAKGEPWGEPTTEAPGLEVEGDDAALARAIRGRPGVLVRFRPAGSDLAAALGLAPGSPPTGTALPLDAIALTPGPAAAPGSELLAVNLVVVGVAPTDLRSRHRRHWLRVTVDGRELFAGRAGSAVIASGQFLRGHDVVPRGHPGDGRLEVQVYALDPAERRSMRARLTTGEHLPHPRIVTGSARRFTVETGGHPVSWSADGLPQRPVSELRGHVLPAAFRILI